MTDEQRVSADAWAWFEREGLVRHAVAADAGGSEVKIVEDARAPLVALGPRDEDLVLAPDPDRMRWPGRRIAQMDMDEYNVFMYRWFEAAVAAGLVRCANCGRIIIDGEDLPDPETWDAILIEKELVAWMVVHFDCKKLLAKKIKGMHPFDLPSVRPAPVYDLHAVDVPPSAHQIDDSSV